MQNTKTKLIITSIVAILSSGGDAMAATTSGSLWHVSESTSQSATLANVPGTTPDVTFDVNSPLNFDATSASVQTWLNSGSAFNIHENTTGTLASLMDNFSKGTLVDFKGSITVATGEDFTVRHDDGLTLIIDGINLGFSVGPTSPTVTTKTYSGPSGTFPFELVYGECCGGPAVLQVEVTIPETSSTLMLLLLSVGILAVLARQKGQVRA
jgi:hypothetical protein